MQRRIHKYQRQNFEHKRQSGRQLIDEEYNRFIQIINKKNYDIINKQFRSNVKNIKNRYNITNVGKSERLWIHKYNIIK